MCFCVALTSLLGLTGDCNSSALLRMKPKVPAVPFIKYNCNCITNVTASRTKL